MNVSSQFGNVNKLEMVKTYTDGARLGLTEEEIDERSRQSVAIHEAGHGVVMFEGPLQEMPSELSIVPGPGTRGHVHRYHVDMPDGKPDLITVEHNAIVLLAGRESERYLWGMNGELDGGSESDLENARKWVGSIAPEEKERQALMDSIEAQTKCLVATYWPIIEAVAEALLVEKVMGTHRFMEIVRDVRLLHPDIPINQTLSRHFRLLAEARAARKPPSRAALIGTAWDIR